MAINSRELVFHLSQSVYRKLQSIGLQSEYHNDPNFALTMRMLPAQAFVSPELVGQIFRKHFQKLVVAFLEIAYPLCRYFEGNYVGLLNLNWERNTPLSLSEMTLDNFHLFSLGLPRTTNLLEAWHCGFQSTCGCHHPTIWKFIDCLKTEQGNVELKQVKILRNEKVN